MRIPFGSGRRPLSVGVRRHAAAVGIAATLLGGGLASAVVSTASGAQSHIATTTTAAVPSDSPSVAPQGYITPSNDGLGVAKGQVKHVWLIVLENKSYDATLTPLNDSLDDKYLSSTLPSQGALLTNYYGTGHSSLDNYLSLASGQAPQTDDQDDCAASGYDGMEGSISMTGSLSTNPDYGQFVSQAGADAPAGQNGCVYPASVPTFFNQLDSAGVSWKVYAQDLGYPDASGPAHDAGTQYCGAPDSSVGQSPIDGSSGTSSAYPNPSSANATDQYVAKHNPLAWFQSMLGSNDCNSAHLQDLFASSGGLLSDLQNESSTPSFSEIIPNNCSNGHDAVCAGNNLSGGFQSDNITPKSPINYTGGVYAENVFLEHVIPEIEASPAFNDGGLIDITWDEAYPPFTYSNSNANSTREAPTAAGSVAHIDSAGETLFGRSVSWEPAGPNTPIVTGVNGQQLSAGPGFNEELDRPTAANGTDLEACTETAEVSTGGCYIGGGNYPPHNTGAATDAGATAASGTSTISDPAIQISDEGRAVCPVTACTGIPAGAYVGQVSDTPAQASQGGAAYTGSFTLVDASGNPLNTTAAVTGGINLAARTTADDPFYDAYDPTLGGGDTGDILIGKSITPGTVSNTYYNHYSTLRSLEDIFGVASASPGLDNQGHIGYAAQPGLAPFGTDVFTAASTGTTSTETVTTTSTQTNTQTTTGPTQTTTGPTVTKTVTTTTPGKTTTKNVVVCVVPKLAGQTLTNAKALLKAAQCGLGKVTGPKSGKVKSTSVKAGKQVKRGTKVAVTLK